MALTQITTNGIKDGTITGTDLATNVDFVDNQKLRLGTGNDLQIYFSGNDAFIENNDMGSTIKFKTRHFVSGFQERVEINAKGDFSILRDDTKLQLGASQDLQIYHDGSNSIIKDNGTGYLNLISNGSGIYLNKSDGESMASFITDGAVELFHNGTKKFETTSTGVVITGNDASGSANLGSLYFKNASGTVRGLFNTTNDRFELKDNVLSTYGNNQDLQIYHDGTASYIKNNNGDLILRDDAIELKAFSTQDTYLYAVNGGSVSIRYDNSVKFETTSSGINVTGQADVDSINCTGELDLVGNLDLNSDTHKIKTGSRG